MFNLLNRRQFWTVVTVVALVGATTAIIRTIDSMLQPEHLVFAYIIPISYVAVRNGTVPAILTALLCGFCAAFFLYPPKFSIYPVSLLHLAELGFFLLLAVAATQFIAVLSDGDRPQTPT